MAMKLDEAVGKLESKRPYISFTVRCADIRRAVNGATDVDGVEEPTLSGNPRTEKDNDDSDDEKDDEAGVNGGKWG